MKTTAILFSISFLLIVGCSSKKSSDELLKEGEKLAGEEKYSEAVTAYETLINDYPDDELAPEAISRLAVIYQNKLLKNFPEKDSFLKAVDLFKSIHEKYPDSKQAPMGLFMAGFVQANELKDFDAATETYKQFIELYPDHELTSSAREELNNMGLTPEEILQKNLAKQK